MWSRCWIDWPAAQPDVVVIDVALTDGSGFDAAGRLRAAGCRAAIVFLSVHEEPEFVDAAWEAGGLGYVAKRDVRSRPGAGGSRGPARAAATCRQPSARHDCNVAPDGGRRCIPREFVDTIAGYMAIFVLVFVPALLIYLFWMVHILPEKIAERRGHPQADAIKTLCLLSLVFGGLLWPIAWLWAYSKPVLYKMAYGTDRVEHAGARRPGAATRPHERGPRGRSNRCRASTDMEVLLLAIYAFFVWLIFFKFKLLAWTTTAAVIVVTIPIIALAGLILLLNVYAPSALDVQVVKYVVQVMPRVTGRVIEVPVEPNRLVRKGDVLFRIDPRPFQYEVDRLEALLASTAAGVGAQREELRAAEAQIEVSLNRVDVDPELDRGDARPPEAGRAARRPDRRSWRRGRRRPVRGRALGDRRGAAARRPRRAAAAARRPPSRR